MREGPLVLASSDWYNYMNLEGTTGPMDWAPATRGDRPWDQCDFHIDLGCGRVPKARIGIDKRPSRGSTDLVIDLETLAPPEVEANDLDIDKTIRHYGDFEVRYGSLPFADNSIESIVSHHALEHIGSGFERLMEECYRVLKWGGVMRVIVPLFPSYSAVGEYDHKRFFMEGTLMGFCQEPDQSYTDGFSERYNNCCFRMLDEDCTPPTVSSKRWTKDDARELRVTLYKHNDELELPEPHPSQFMPEGAWDEFVEQTKQPQPRRSRLRGHREVSEPEPDALEGREPVSTGVFRPQPIEGDRFASVCVLSYERPDLLKECIGSMMATAEADFELIVHDDGSMDTDLREWLVRLSNEGVISTLLMNSPGWNEGQGVAMNRMAAVAKGDPIIKCDQDLIFQSGWLRTVHTILDRNQSEVGDGDEPLIGALGLFKYEVDPVDYRKMLLMERGGWSEVKDFVGSLLVMPRMAWEIFGPWGEYSAAFAEDALYKQAVTAAEGWCCALTQEDLVINQGFGIGPSTVVTAPGTVQPIKDRPKVYLPQGV